MTVLARSWDMIIAFHRKHGQMPTRIFLTPGTQLQLDLETLPVNVDHTKTTRMFGLRIYRDQKEFRVD